ncbi:unnamed protein product [Leptidea sinapis]|uniref:Uncharacterized protein n=1 Tax=Leptidea sinapis TaxID=189913 RepID=A0A5E4QPP2_9NEOP|nr:unnamed protein product [Leptidea sinapis]
MSFVKVSSCCFPFVESFVLTKLKHKFLVFSHNLYTSVSSVVSCLLWNGIRFNSKLIVRLFTLIKLLLKTCVWLSRRSF